MGIGLFFLQSGRGDRLKIIIIIIIAAFFFSLGFGGDPYDIPLEQRYSFVNGVHRLWVYADDKPHNPNSNTQPRTEIQIKLTFSHNFSLHPCLHGQVKFKLLLASIAPRNYLHSGRFLRLY
jgi:hypothetical protein